MRGLARRLLAIALGLLVFLIILALGLLGLELFVRTFKPQITYSQALGLSPTYYAPGGVTGFTLRPKAKYGSVNINSLGYRGKEFLEEKPPGVYRILFLGDSFIFGWGVKNDEETVPALLENILNTNLNQKFEVINAGFRDGYSPDNYYAYLKNEGFKLQPDMIIEALYLQNDIADLYDQLWDDLDKEGLPERVLPAPWRAVDENGRLIDTIMPLRYKFAYLREWHLWILLANWLDKNYPSFYKDKEMAMVQKYAKYYYLSRGGCVFNLDCMSAFFKPEYDRMIKVANGTVALYKVQRIPFLFVFVPSVVQLGIDPGFSAVAPEWRFTLQQKVVDDINKVHSDVNYLDLTSSFLIPNTFELYNHPDTHWNADGNRLAAKIIAKKIQETFTEVSH